MASSQSMANPTVAPPLVPMEPTKPPVHAPDEHRFMIRNIDWAAYKQISDALVDRHYYMSYDGEDLELMTISGKHSQLSRIFGLLVFTLAEEFGLPHRTSGDMTMRREDLEQAIEPDESFYLENEPKVRHRDQVDLAVDPPPDLGIEIDLTTDSRRRLGIYAKIAVPEIWRHDGRTVTIYQRQSDGQYLPVESSKSFPFLASADLERFLQQRVPLGEAVMLQSFRQWAREQIAKQS